MPRFFKKGKKSAPKKVYRAPRRRLQPTAGALLAGAVAVGKRVYKRRQNNANALNKKASNAFKNRVTQSDNILSARPVKIGKPRKISFQEKVSRAVRPPLLFKRNFAFSSECVSGRKGWFSMEINRMTSVDLQPDITTYKNEFFTSTSTVAGEVPPQSGTDSARFYVDYHSEKIQMVNSSSNSITGKVHLFAHKRDNTNSYGTDTIPISPINLMMYYSTSTVNTAITAGAGSEVTVGNGWAFGTTAGNTNYIGNYNMPGSSINSGGFTASTDPELSPLSASIADRMGYWFRKVSTSDFSLKPGQQFNSSFLFNDLPKIFREEQVQYVHLAGISYTVCVEFRAGIVGDSTVANSISTGDCQLSVIRESKRIIGCENTLKTKVYLQTAPLATIAIANQVIINSDTGVGLSGTVIDA